MISRRRRARAGSDEASNNIAGLVDDIEPEPFEEMYSVFRIVALYEMMIHAQWKYVVHYLDTRKTELVLGMYIGAAFELIRFVCVLVIAIVFILLRISALIPLHHESIIGNITWILSMNSLAFWSALILACVIIAQFAVYQCRNPNYVVYCTTINFLLSIIIIASIIHLAVLKANNGAFMREAFHKNLLSSGSMRGLLNYQARLKCCGVMGPEDYRNEFILKKGTYFTRGCLDEYVESIESYSSVLISTIIIFTIFTALTIAFVIVLLLYHDGVGHIISDQKMFGVERNTGVHFLMSLDMVDSDFPDDFSLIEFLRNSDIDKFMAEDKLKGTIGGRKEAERA
ncbi:hypothetical protein CAEBREN_21141 [Caenorhabditis brenneri]|uniref:Uncharacterized protein n=1 Tax=Caenorhabditis brenneri TaxID=135651 RepID=G0NWJ7_CAEBE|nr:hypothetical protein CAEBREN_21141 [Caenorhabditis brenneri]